MSHTMAAGHHHHRTAATTTALRLLPGTAVHWHVIRISRGGGRRYCRFVGSTILLLLLLLLLYIIYIYLSSRHARNSFYNNNPKKDCVVASRLVPGIRLRRRTKHQVFSPSVFPYG